MLLIVEKGIGCGIHHSVYQYAEPNNIYMEDFDLNKESLYLMYWDTNNLYGWTISQNVPVAGFRLVT